MDHKSDCDVLAVMPFNLRRALLSDLTVLKARNKTSET
jgi:hypothetical protein